MLQMRVFYAMTDSRTPTLIQIVMIVVKIPLLLLCAVLLPPTQVVLGLAAANGLSFVVGAIIGQVLLARRLGRVRTREVLSTLWRTTAASIVGSALAWAIGRLLANGPLDDWPAVGQAWMLLAIGAVIALPVTVVMMRVLRVAELDTVFQRFSRR